MSKRAEEFANKAYPNYSPDGKTQVDMYAYRFACAKGYEQAEENIISLIESRIGEILGDAQPAPILRTELMELIKKIKK